MAVRAIWKGVLRLGGESVPVRLYSAVEDRKVHFHLLHERDGARVRQCLVHPETGKEVPRDEIRRGVEVGPGRIVILDEEELEELEPQASRDIEVLRVVPRETIPH